MEGYILIGLCIIFFASMVQGMTSFGFSLLAVPLLGFIFPLEVIVPMMVLYSLLMNGIILMRLEDKPDMRSIALIIATGLVGTPIGAHLLKTANPDLLKMSVGVVIAVSSVLMMLGIKASMKNRALSLAVTGMFSGLLNGSISMSGPPVILFLRNEDHEKGQFRVNLTMYFFLLNILTVGIFILNDLVGLEVMKTSVMLLPALLAGSLMGIFLGNRTDEQKFKRVTLMLIFIMGLLSIFSSNPMQFFS